MVATKLFLRLDFGLASQSRLFRLRDFGVDFLDGFRLVFADDATSGIQLNHQTLVAGLELVERSGSADFKPRALVDVQLMERVFNLNFVRRNVSEV